MITIHDLNLDRKLFNGIALTFALKAFRTVDKDSVDYGRAFSRLCHLLCANISSRNYVPTLFEYDHLSARSYALSSISNAYSSFNLLSLDYITANIIADTNRCVYNSYMSLRAHGEITSFDKYVHTELVKLLPIILDYKIENKRPFGNPEKILDHLNKTDKIKFLFSVNILS